MKEKLSILMIGVVIAIFLIGVADADTGGIYFDSNPTGAQIYVKPSSGDINSYVYKGITPALISVDAGSWDAELIYYDYNGGLRDKFFTNLIVTAGTVNNSTGKVDLPYDTTASELRVRTQPDGATAKIGGINIGKTPITGIQALISDGTVLTLEKEGFFTNTTTGNEGWKKYYVGNNTYEVFVVLHPNNVGSATFNSNPPGANVFVDSDTVPRGITPYKVDLLTSGVHSYTLSLSGYSNSTGSFTITPNEGGVPTQVFASLAPIQSVNVFLETIPSGASITVDGTLVKDILTANFVILSKNSDHNILFKKANYKDQTLLVSEEILSALPAGSTYIWPDKILFESLNIAVTAPDNGKIEPLDGSDIIYGQNKTYFVTPNPCYYVESFLVNGITVLPATYPAANYTFVNVTANQTFGAKISRIKYNITGNAFQAGYWYPNTNPNGYILPNGTWKADCGSSVKISVVNGTGYNIDTETVNNTTWTGQKSLIEIPIVSSDNIVNVTFAIQKFNVIATSGIGGKIYPTYKNTTVYDYGDTERFVAVADSGYSLSDMRVNNVSLVPLQPYLNLSPITKDYQIYANFTPNLNTVNATCGAVGVSQDTPDVGGNITPKGIISIPFGQPQTFDITPWDCYTIKGVYVNGQNIGSVTNYTFVNVTSPQSIYARFIIRNYTIRTQAMNAGGTITPTSVSTCGTNKTIEIKPDYGFYIDKIYVDSEASVGPLTDSWTRTFSDYKDHNINTTFGRSATGFLRINSNPIGATIMVDGLDRGTTPRSIEVPVGQHLVTLKKTWYQTDIIPNVAIVKGLTTDLGTRTLKLAILP